MNSGLSKNPYAARMADFQGLLFNSIRPKQNLKHYDSVSFFSLLLGDQTVPFQEKLHELGFERRGKRKTVLELGCSNAHFLGEVAHAHPEAAFFGVDWKYKVLWKGAQFLSQFHLKNLVLLRGLAELAACYSGEQSLDEVWVLFPDPWAKKGQQKKRLINSAFLLSMSKALKPSGRILFKTDHPGYFQSVLALFGRNAEIAFDYDARKKQVDPTVASYSLKQNLVRQTETTEIAQNEIDNLLKHYELGLVSTDFHADITSKRLDPKTVGFLAETNTLFEKSFIREGLPIYFIEILTVPRSSA
jgi:tRNA (guanine-N(7)-)-methyltransferase